MQFWTKEEYQRFAEAVMDKPMSYYAFEMLYWCGIREGELLALTPGDFNFKAGTVSINKSYQRLHGEDVITTPKTKKSIRTIKMPKFLCEEMQEYVALKEQLDAYKPDLAELKSKLTDLKHIRYNYKILIRDIPQTDQYQRKGDRMER